MTKEEYKEMEELYPELQVPPWYDVDPWWWENVAPRVTVEDWIGRRLACILRGDWPDDKGGPTIDEQTKLPGPMKLYHPDLCER